MMYWLENMRLLSQENGEDSSAEFLVTVDAQFVGEVEYGPYWLRLWTFGDVPAGENRYLCLGINERIKPLATDPGQLSKKGFYHYGGVPGELVALASLFLRRRMRLGPLVRMEDRPVVGKPKKTMINEQLAMGRANLTDLAPWLKLTAALAPEYQLPFILSAKRYSRALQFIETEPDIAYMELVCAVETLAQADIEGDISIGLEDLNPKVAEVIRKIADPKLQKELCNTMRELVGAKKKFRMFVERYTAEEFWAESKPGRGRVTCTELKKSIDLIHGQRSNTSHTGQDFPPTVYLPPFLGEETPQALMMTSAQRRWKPKDYVPHVSFFERLAQHLITNFLRAKTEGLRQGNWPEMEETRNV